ncbi:MAG: ATP-dependent helicase HrpB [Bryobacteraceae bacterium]
MISLPVDAILADVLVALRERNNLVIEAPPGAGKTTRVPAALLDAFEGDVLVLEPRRLAARMAARRVAQERQERLGDTVGYQVRFEDVSSPRTRLKFVTEGVLVRRMLSDPSLRGVSTVVLDEFHERHLDGDAALALLRRLQNTKRPELRLVVMSATLDALPVAEYLEANTLKSEGRLFDLAIEHTPHSAAPLEEQVASGLERALKAQARGDILVFLPGAAEIRRVQRACDSIARSAKLALVTLHGDLSPDEQDRALTSGPQRKVILSTNVAESSITIEGVTAVIDSGLARIASDSPWTGLPRLDIGRISKASAKQRAGRAARTAPGHVVRLYSLDDFVRRPEHDSPEITRRELSQLVLDLRTMGVRELDWLDAPPAAAWQAATDLLERLGALDGGTVTATGRKMAQLPVHPRLARLMLEAGDRKAPRAGCAAAAVLSAGERAGGNPARVTDLHDLVEGDWQPTTRRVFDQLRRILTGADRASDSDEAVRWAVLAAFPDRIARRRREGEALLSAGGSARAEGVHSEFFVAVDIEERRDRGLPFVRLASAIEPEWLLELYSDRVLERRTVEWNRAAERVEQVNALVYDQLVIEEKRGGKADSETAAALLADRAAEVDLGRFVDRDALALLQARTAFAAHHSKVQPITDETVAAALRELAGGCTSFKDLEGAGLLHALEARAGRAELDRAAPPALRLAGGRQVKVHYEPGKPPWIESRLQDFFGMRETPSVSGTPVVVHLLAPNQRPVQVTSDLGGFWERLYPQVRRELMRRYPKHKWPEDPRLMS